MNRLRHFRLCWIIELADAWIIALNYCPELLPMSLLPSSHFHGYALALHTSSPELGLALSNFSGDSRCGAWDLGRSLSTDLHNHLQDFLQPQGWQDLTFLAVAKGPGGFTGTRIGVVTARTLAQQLNLPLFAVSSLAAFANSMRDRRLNEAGSNAANHAVDIAVQMPAQRGELFTAIYSSLDPTQACTALFPDTVLSTEQWQQVLEQWPRPYQLLQADGGLGRSAISLLQLAEREWCDGLRPAWTDALPFYGQHPIVG